MSKVLQRKISIYLNYKFRIFSNFHTTELIHCRHILDNIICLINFIDYFPTFLINFQLLILNEITKEIDELFDS